MRNELKMETTEHTTIDALLVQHYGNQTRVAKLLGVNRGTFRRMVAEKRDNVVLLTEDGYKLLVEFGYGKG